MSAFPPKSSCPPFDTISRERTAQGGVSRIPQPNHGIRAAYHLRGLHGNADLGSIDDRRFPSVSDTGVQIHVG